jgi:hypothetical protein
MVLSHLKKVGQLPPEVQADIAKRVGTYLKLASAAKTDELKSEVRISPRQATKAVISSSKTPFACATRAALRSSPRR